MSDEVAKRFRREDRPIALKRFANSPECVYFYPIISSSYAGFSAPTFMLGVIRASGYRPDDMVRSDFFLNVGSRKFTIPENLG